MGDGSARRRDHRQGRPPEDRAGIPGEFFVLRAPALPFDTLERWGAELEAPGSDEAGLDAALARDRAVLRDRLQALLERQEVRAAMFVASPDLAGALSRDHSEKAEAAAVRYLERMAGRPVPFGLFAGCGVGEIGERTALRLPPLGEWRRSTRLDAEYLDGLVRALVASPELRDRVRLSPNGSLWRCAGRLRYVESRLDGGERSHHLVDVALSEPLECALSAAEGGARAPEVVAALVASGVPDPGATAFVRKLVDAQVLVADLDVQITGAPALEALVEDLARLDAPDPVLSCLERTQSALGAIDDAGVAADPARYRDVARDLELLPANVALERLFQVDVSIPLPGATLGRDMAEEIAGGVELLRRLAPAPGSKALLEFKDALRERYDDQEVPLLEALDDEIGVGFGGGSDPAPLLKGLQLGQRSSERPFGRREEHMLRLLHQVARDGAHEIALSAEDIQTLESDDPPPMPDAFAALAVLARTTDGPRIVLQNGSGPSGARLLGRFCHTDPQLEAAVRDHIVAEEALAPDALFAEIVHLPSGRMANILARPVLREYEIEWLGRSGAPPSRRLPASDLVVCVRDGRIVLRSLRLDRRVIPRLTSAHNWDRRSPGVYRFLCAVQTDGVSTGLGWTWEPFAAASFTPRVRCGRLVLARARWRLQRDELRGLARDAWTGSQTLRRERILPRWVVLADGDNLLPVDLDNVLSVDAFARIVRGRDEAVLEELYPRPDELIAEGSDGRYVHELLIPLTRRRPVAATPTGADHVVTGTRADGPPRARRVFPPGSEWAYLKLYAGTASADRLLREEIGPLAERLVGQGLADKWFFIRYADPGHHLRVRFHGDPAGLRTELEQAAAGALESGLAHDAAFGTYRREIERYGGPAAIELAERLFHADSDAVVELLGMFEPGEAGLEERWRIGLIGTEQLMCDLGLDARQRQALSLRMQQTFEHDFRPTAANRHKLGERYRAQRAELELLLDLRPTDEHPLAPGLDVLARRSVRVASIARELRELQARGLLTVPVEELAVSFVHMWILRLVRSSNRVHEWLIYDLLARLHRAREMRSSNGGRSAPAASHPGFEP
ncbi:MAG: lantibiotic dehydratase [Solirubrobacteraceae bacterium]